MPLHFTVAFLILKFVIIILLVATVILRALIIACKATCYIEGSQHILPSLKNSQKIGFGIRKFTFSRLKE